MDFSCGERHADSSSDPHAAIDRKTVNVGPRKALTSHRTSFVQQKRDASPAQLHHRAFLITLLAIVISRLQVLAKPLIEDDDAKELVRVVRTPRTVVSTQCVDDLPIGNPLRHVTPMRSPKRSRSEAGVSKYESSLRM
jgi:hypothetical protein